jgi:predicted dinucleotide-binding enzyme
VENSPQQRAVPNGPLLSREIVPWYEHGMKIAVIGAGSVGCTLGNAWRRRGHNVSYGVRNPDDDKYGALGGNVTSNVRAVHGADVVVRGWPLGRQYRTAATSWARSSSTAPTR